MFYVTASSPVQRKVSPIFCSNFVLRHQRAHIQAAPETFWTDASKFENFVVCCAVIFPCFFYQVVINFSLSLRNQGRNWVDTEDCWPKHTNVKQIKDKFRCFWPYSTKNKQTPNCVFIFLNVFHCRRYIIGIIKYLLEIVWHMQSIERTKLNLETTKLKRIALKMFKAFK